MPKLQVAVLNYRAIPGPLMTFENPEPVERDTSQFRLRLADGILRVELKEPHASEASARAVVDPYLRRWEVAAVLRRGRRELRFEFDRAELIDLEPEPGVISVWASGEAHFSSSVAVSLGLHAYPEP